MRKDACPSGKIGLYLLGMLLLALLMFPSESRGEIRKFAFHGVITDVHEDRENFPLDTYAPEIAPGLPFEGFYLIDTDVADADPSPGFGYFNYRQAPCGLTVKMGSAVFHSTPHLVDYNMEITSGHIGMSSHNNLSSKPFMVQDIQTYFACLPGTLTNDVHPLLPPAIATSQSYVEITGFSPSYVIRGRVNGVTSAVAAITNRPALTVRPAVEIKWPSQLGSFYQLQYSNRVTQEWEDSGEPWMGDGTVMSAFTAPEPLAAAYRARLKKFASDEEDPLPADAARLTFSGTVRTLENFYGVVSRQIQVGTPLQGEIIYGTAMEDANSSSPDIGDYLYEGEAFRMAVKIGGHVFRTDPSRTSFLLELVNEGGQDFFQIQSDYSICSGSLQVKHFDFDFNGPATTFTNDLLASFPPAMSALTNGFLNLDITGQGFAYYMNCTIESLQAAGPPSVTNPVAATVQPALEIRLSSRLGDFYQVQASADLQVWNNVGEPIFGDGEMMSQFLPQNPTSQLFYRTEIRNAPAATGP